MVEYRSVSVLECLSVIGKTSPSYWINCGMPIHLAKRGQSEEICLETLVRVKKVAAICVCLDKKVRVLLDPGHDITVAIQLITILS